MVRSVECPAAKWNTVCEVESPQHVSEVGLAYRILGFDEWIVHGDDLHIAMLDPNAKMSSQFFGYSIRGKAIDKDGRGDGTHALRKT